MDKKPIRKEKSIISSSVKIGNKIIDLRHYFHKFPELSNREENTSKKIVAELKVLGLEYRDKIGGYGVVGLLRGRFPGKTVAVRADMDALPLLENNNVPYKSQNPGIMHACGHDAHMAVVLGTAMLLISEKERIKGNVKFIFQPAEEKPPGGAIRMIEAGVLLDPSVDAVFGLHNSTDTHAGEIIVPKGTIMAGSDQFTVSITGPGGHGGMPEKTVDTILIASQFVVILQNVIKRKFSQNDQPVISIGRIEGGTAHNIIPKEVTLSGTVRYFCQDSERIAMEIRCVLQSLSNMFGGDFKLNYTRGYPVTINDNDLADLVRSAASKTEGISRVGKILNKAYVSEDFGYFSQKLPSCYFIFGGKNRDKGIYASPHTAEFNLDEEFLPFVSQLVVTSVLEYLQ